MLRLMASAILHLLANTVGLLLASLLLDGFSINATAFIGAVLIFTVVEVVAGPLLAKIALTNVPSLIGGIALVTTFAGLLVTNLVSDGLSISGISTWVLSTLIVWLCALIAGLILPLLLFKKVLDKHKSED
jgi:putative membrane protein